MTATKDEIELKLSVAKSALARLARWAQPDEWLATDIKRRRLTAIYYDTADLRLYRLGIALRVRRGDKKFKRTIKYDTALENGLSRPREYEDQVASTAPEINTIADRKLRMRILGALGDTPVEPVFETVIQRQSRRIEVPDVGSVELALDSGHVHTRDSKQAISELEVELCSGQPYVILTVAEALMEGVAFEPSATSKAGTGYALLEASGSPANDRPAATDGDRPGPAPKPRITGDMTIADALIEIGQPTCRQVLAAMQGCMMSDELEMPHRLRVSLRRLRTALRLCRPLAATPAMRALARDARDLGRVVGELRDADVLLTDVITPAAREGAISTADEQGLLAIARDHRERRRLAVRKSISSTRWNTLRLNALLFDYAVARAAAEQDSQAARAALPSLAHRRLAKCWRRTSAWGDRIEDLDVEERHEMRKSLKELRYAAEFFSPLLPGSGAFLKRLRKLQDIFGYLNDVTLTDRLVQLAAAEARRRKPNRSAGAAQLRDAARNIRDWHEARAEHAWQSAKDNWNDLRDKAPDWV